MYKYRDVLIDLKKGDITQEKTEAIVNAANNTLLGGGGVDGAIHRAGGQEILEQCLKIGGCPTGEARITVAGNLYAEYVIHTVGPIYEDGSKQEPEFLYKAYYNSLRLAEEYDLKSIAFPSISTGVYGYPIELAVKVVLRAVKDFIDRDIESIESISFILFSQEDYNLYKKYFDENL